MTSVFLNVLVNTKGSHVDVINLLLYFIGPWRAAGCNEFRRCHVVVVVEVVQGKIVVDLLGRIDIASQFYLVNELVTPAALPARSLGNLTDVLLFIPFVEFLVHLRRDKDANNEKIFGRKGGRWEVGSDSQGEKFVDPTVESGKTRDEGFLSVGHLGGKSIVSFAFNNGWRFKIVDSNPRWSLTIGGFVTDGVSETRDCKAKRGVFIIVPIYRGVNSVQRLLRCREQTYH